MKFKPVFRYDAQLRMVRLFRLLFRTKGYSGPGYCAKLSLAVWPKPFGFTRDWREWSFTLLGLRLHFLASPGMV